MEKKTKTLIKKWNHCYFALSLLAVLLKSVICEKWASVQASMFNDMQNTAFNKPRLIKTVLREIWTRKTLPKASNIRAVLHIVYLKHTTRMQSQHPEGRNSFGELLSFRQIYACKHHSHHSMRISRQLKVRDAHVWMFVCIWRRNPRLLTLSRDADI